MEDIILFDFSESFEHKKLDEKGKPYKTYTGQIKLYGSHDKFGNIKECWFQIEIYADRLIYYSLERWFYIAISIKLCDFSSIEEIVELIRKSIKLPSSNSEISRTLLIHNGQYYGVEYGVPYLEESNIIKEIQEEIQFINITAGPKGVTFVPLSKDKTITLGNLVFYPTIYYSSKDTYYCEDLKDDIENYNKLINFLGRVIRYLELAKSSTMLTVDLKQFNDLSQYEYGDEVLKHLHDGVKCVECKLLHPALNSFLHAIEWALIMGLKVKGRDIVDEERKNKKKRYYLSHLIDEAHKLGLISDKMRDRLQTFNESHRRWTAHHKTGEVIEDDIRYVTKLFEELIKEFNKL